MISTSEVSLKFLCLESQLNYISLVRSLKTPDVLPSFHVARIFSQTHSDMVNPHYVFHLGTVKPLCKQ